MILPILHLEFCKPLPAMLTIQMLFLVFVIESKDNYRSVPISKIKQCYEPTKFSNRSKKSTQLYQCVLSSKNIIFNNFVQIKSINSLFVNM